jgi:CRP-like cAMP-binding protein
MIIEEVQLFRDLGPDVMQEIADAAQEETHPAKRLLFNRGDVADNLYVLVEGNINVFIREEGTINFILDESGDIFGWSSLVEPNLYTASAECSEETKVLKIDRTRLEHIFERHPREAYLIMKRLAGVVGQRLLSSYEDLLRSRTKETAPSYG